MLQSSYVQTEGNISVNARISRAIAAIAMLAYPMLEGVAPIDLVALLPLVAIYPMYTAVVGWDPVAFVVTTAQAQGKYAQIKFAARLVLFVTGAGLIGATLAVASYGDKLGGYSVLALVGILPVYAAIIDENPLTALRDSITALRVDSEANAAQSVVNGSTAGIDKSIGDVNVQVPSATTGWLHDKAA